MQTYQMTKTAFAILIIVLPLLMLLGCAGQSWKEAGYNECIKIEPAKHAECMLYGDAVEARKQQEAFQAIGLWQGMQRTIYPQQYQYQQPFWRAPVTCQQMGNIVTCQ